MKALPPPIHQVPFAIMFFFEGGGENILQSISRTIANQTCFLYISKLNLTCIFNDQNHFDILIYERHSKVLHIVHM